MKLQTTSVLIFVFGFVIVTLLGWSYVSRVNNPDLVAMSGLHWHAHLSIIVAGKEVPIPANIGLGAAEMALHTHDAGGSIHMEFSGTVRKQDLTLGQFFRVWGKDMRSFGSNMRMTVNGKENVEYEQYEMRDGDTIELQYD